jgi:hypothetical protein
MTMAARRKRRMARMDQRWSEGRGLGAGDRFTLRFKRVSRVRV